MINVTKDFTKPPASFSHSNCKSQVEECIQQKKYIESDWYKKQDIKNALKLIYKNKCAYCEGYSSAQAPFQVEHYRPKKEVSIIKKNMKTKVEKHQGYYWLAYEWSNLLWSCYWCNQKKSSLFPLEDESDRISNPPLDNSELDSEKCQSNCAELLAEKPMLLNPEIDHAEEHFYFKRNGKIKSITKRGKATIRICQLNREDLCLARRKLVDDFYTDITTEVAGYLEDQTEIGIQNFKRNIRNILTKIYQKAKPENEYSRFGYFMFLKFEYFFIKKSDFDDLTKKKLLDIYKEFVSNVMA